MTTSPADQREPAVDPFPPAAPGYVPRRTLPLRVEAVRQLRRRRTLVVGLLLALLPPLVAVAFAVGGAPDDSESALLDSATASGPNFAAVCLYLSAGFLLVVPVALFCGDTVASEAGWSSLRYLLAAPVPRWRLLTAKLLVALAFSAVAMVLLPLSALGVGTVAYGWGELRLPTGGTLPGGEAALRLALALAAIFVGQLVTAALAFWLSTVTDAPLGAVGGAIGLTILGSILDAITALGDWRQLIPAHWLFAWLDALQRDVEWNGMLRGGAVSLAYALLLVALAYRHFARKDIVS
ncbi:ABC-2 type transport system permease protein [Streptomyces zhaozhouensis]|uniref:ABC-2 type transport system permease protein n=1 Tax=Streptomyces zhaozhouensis TaxID=1300267 RepID=A0A286DSX6_9ACTN|nr:ABC transporter permease subunit [Streptomyces zhaozhouensis]SOD61750.1 ABC-2 type transport system permease protein [Streptomyces zhaozhouensis]